MLHFNMLCAHLWLGREKIPPRLKEAPLRDKSALQISMKKLSGSDDFGALPAQPHKPAGSQPPVPARLLEGLHDFPDPLGIVPTAHEKSVSPVHHNQVPDPH